MIHSRQEGWAQYVLPAENALPDGLVTASSAVDIGADAPAANDLFDDREELAQLMIETRAVLARQGIHLLLFTFLIRFCVKCSIHHHLKNCRRQWLCENHRIRFSVKLRCCASLSMYPLVLLNPEKLV